MSLSPRAARGSAKTGPLFLSAFHLLGERRVQDGALSAACNFCCDALELMLGDAKTDGPPRDGRRFRRRHRAACHHFVMEQADEFGLA